MKLLHEKPLVLAQNVYLLGKHTDIYWTGENVYAFHPTNATQLLNIP